MYSRVRTKQSHLWDLRAWLQSTHSALQPLCSSCNIVHVTPHPASNTKGNSMADSRHLSLAPALETGTQSIIQPQTAAQHSYNNTSHSWRLSRTHQTFYTNMPGRCSWNSLDSQWKSREKKKAASRYKIFWDSIQAIIAVLKLALKILDMLLMGMKTHCVTHYIEYCWCILKLPWKIT